MRLRTIIKLATITSVILLCVGYAISLYFKMTVIERAEDFDLYTLVPPDSRLIVDTDNMVGLMQHINELNCSKDNHFMHFSHFFSYLKEHINSFLEQTPHGLSKQMNKMLISFHEPESDRDQVFYCRLGTGDYEFMEQFIRKYSSGSFPTRFFDYRGEEIRIYPMPGDLFLACYVDSEFLVLSYQKRLVEQVIDARLAEKSILSDEMFSKIRSGHRMIAPVTIYTRMQAIEMGQNSDTLRYHSDLGDWTEFNINLNGDAIYLSGINYDTDSCETFANALRVQEPISDLSEDMLPESTFFFTKTSISDLEEMLDFTSRHNYIQKTTYPEAIMKGDEAMLDFLGEYAGSMITTCMFHSNDTLSDVPCAVVNIPLKRHSGEEQKLSNLYRIIPRAERLSLYGVEYITTPAPYACYALPRNTLFARLTGITEFSLTAYACLYENSLLLAPDIASLQAYIEFNENSNEFLEGGSTHEDITASLSRSYNFMMIADMEQVLEQPESYVRFMPNLFFRHNKFFRHFVLTTQFTCVEGVVYPNLILTYKGRGITGSTRLQIKMNSVSDQNE